MGMRRSFKAGLVGVAVAGAVAIPAGAAHAGAWSFAGNYQHWNDCYLAGTSHVLTGDALNYDCEPDTGGTYDLYLFYE